MMRRADVRNTASRDGDFIWKTKDQWGSTYWSGLDARIYAGDVLLDEILSLQFQLQEAVAPLFGYHAYTYDSLMHGSRRVQGAFTLNFKQEQFLFRLLQQLSGTAGADPSRTAPSVGLRNSDAARVARTGTATIEDFVAFAAGQNTQLDGGTFRADPQLLDRAADDFEAAIWGQAATTSNAEANDELERFQIDPHRPRFALPRTFELAIQFGSVSEEETKRRRASGGLQPLPAETVETPVSTSTRILGVALTGVSREIDDSGRPVLESYTFLARDLL